MEAQRQRLISPKAAFWMQSFEGFLPLRGRWLRTFLRAVSLLSLLTFLLCGLAVSVFVPHLLSARNVRISSSPRWGLSEEHGNWNQGYSPSLLRLGPLRVAYQYPNRVRGHSPYAGLLLLAIQFVVFALPMLVAKKVSTGSAFTFFAWGFGATTCLLLFPLGMACGPMGSQSIQPWQLLFYLLQHLLRW